MLEASEKVDEWNEFYDYSMSVGALPVMAEKAAKGIACLLYTSRG